MGLENALLFVPLVSLFETESMPHFPELPVGQRLSILFLFLDNLIVLRVYINSTSSLLANLHLLSHRGKSRSAAKRLCNAFPSLQAVRHQIFGNRVLIHNPRLGRSLSELDDFVLQQRQLLGVVLEVSAHIPRLQQFGFEIQLHQHLNVFFVETGVKVVDSVPEGVYLVFFQGKFPELDFDEQLLLELEEPAELLLVRLFDEVEDQARPVSENLVELLEILNLMQTKRYYVIDVSQLQSAALAELFGHRLHLRVREVGEHFRSGHHNGRGVRVEVGEVVEPEVFWVLMIVDDEVLLGNAIEEMVGAVGLMRIASQEQSLSVHVSEFEDNIEHNKLVELVSAYVKLAYVQSASVLRLDLLVLLGFVDRPLGFRPELSSLPVHQHHLLYGPLPYLLYLLAVAETVSQVQLLHHKHIYLLPGVQLVSFNVLPRADQDQPVELHWVEILGEVNVFERDSSESPRPSTEIGKERLTAAFARSHYEHQKRLLLDDFKHCVQEGCQSFSGALGRQHYAQRTVPFQKLLLERMGVQELVGVEEAAQEGRVVKPAQELFEGL